MRCSMRSRLVLVRHTGALLFFAVLTVAWTWPLVEHIGDALPGVPGDNYSFVWNLWWMRFALAHPEVGYFHTNYLFFLICGDDRQPLENGHCNSARRDPASFP